MDEVDRAQQTNEQFQAGALAEARNPAATKPSRFTCRECEEPIPEARRQAQSGCELCVDCQSLHENWRPL